VEETDSGDACCAGSEALWGVFLCDAAESVDRDGSGGGAGFVQGIETGGGGDEVSGNGFSEDRGEEDGVGAVASGDLDLGEGVAGDGDDRGWEAETSVASADVVGEKGGVGGKVQTVGTALEGGMEAAVDEEAGGGRFGCDGGEDARGQVGEIVGEKVFFAELDEVDSVAGPQRGLTDEGSLLLGFVP